jgi:N-methylhydantoinase A
LGVVRIAEAEMTRALRVLTVERGIDPRGLTLLAFGGAGGMHACRLAEELELGRILVPRAAGVLSALGLAVSDVRRDYVTAFFRRLDELGPDDLDAAFARLEERARAEVDAPTLERLADVRYRGQSFELTVRADGPLAAVFHAAHERRYGYRDDDAPVEVVALRLTATAPVPKPRLGRGEPATAEPASRRACFDGTWRETAVRDARGVGAAERVEGPAVLAFPEATCVVRPGWSATRDGAGALVLERV